MTTVTLQINFRPHQQRAWENDTRFMVRVWHRRAGKTFYSVLAQVIRCIQSDKDDHRAFYIAPTFKQAKAIAWDMARGFLRGVPGITFNESELRIDFPNGARLQLLGAEQYDSLRGRYADDIVVDETALVPGVAWTQVMSPMLADRQGRCTFIGTPAGRMNLLYELYTYATTSGDPEWSADVLTYKDTNVLDTREVERMRRQMRHEEFEQELMCSWDAALRGAYYLQEMKKVDESGRITSIAYDSALPVTVALDLGWSDETVAVFHQSVGNEHRIIKCQAYTQTAIPDIIRHWHTLPFNIDQVLLPHDAKVHELSTGTTREEVFLNHGCNVQIVSKLDIHEGIDQVRRALPHTWFDQDGTRTLIEALRAYRSEYDEVKNVHSTRPVHNWASHYADAVRYLFTGLGDPLNTQSKWGARPQARLGVYA